MDGWGLLYEGYKQVFYDANGRTLGPRTGNRFIMSEVHGMPSLRKLHILYQHHHPISVTG